MMDKVPLEELQVEIDQLREENTRIVAESKQCHARNDEMCHEHFLLKAELELTRNAVKLVIGRDNGKPWTEVPDTDVDGYIDFIRLHGTHCTRLGRKHHKEKRK